MGRMWTGGWRVLGAFLGMAGGAGPALGADDRAGGPLRVHPENPRYFTDGTKLSDGSLKVVYLTGSHTWANLIDRGAADPPPVFDFDGYLQFLQQNNHNFIRLWARHVSWYHEYGQEVLYAAPLPWSRTGPGEALDGKAKFDLSQLHEPYFERLRSRIMAARDRGIYVSVMLFGGQYECQGGWRGNPFHAENNINGINGDPNGEGNGLMSHTLKVNEINRFQAEYIRKVMDTLGDLDNVLYEISNEGHEASYEWQQHWVEFIHEYERSKPKQHPVGVTALYVEDRERNQRLLEGSTAEWISPLTDAAGVLEMAPSGGGKVSILDSDHWFVQEIYNQPAFGREWVWKAFCGGHQPILMEHLPPVSFVDPRYPLSLEDPGYIASRKAMGHTRQFAERIRLGAMFPAGELASTGCCLANKGEEYLIYQPDAGERFSVNLERGQYRCEWFNVVSGGASRAGEIAAAGGIEWFEPAGANEAVLYLKLQAAGE